MAKEVLKCGKCAHVNEHSTKFCEMCGTDQLEKVSIGRTGKAGLTEFEKRELAEQKKIAEAKAAGESLAGELVLKRKVAFRNVEVFRNGYVRVDGPFKEEETVYNVVPRKLISAVISETDIDPATGRTKAFTLLLLTEDGQIPIFSKDSLSTTVAAANEIVAVCKDLVDDAQVQTIGKNIKVADGGLATNLERLVALRESGGLTESEFQQAKKKLLDGD